MRLAESGEDIDPIIEARRALGARKKSSIYFSDGDKTQRFQLMAARAKPTNKLNSRNLRIFVLLSLIARGEETFRALN